MFNFQHTDEMILDLYIKVGLLTHAANKALDLLTDPEGTESEESRVIQLLNISLEKV